MTTPSSCGPLPNGTRDGPEPVAAGPGLPMRSRWPREGAVNASPGSAGSGYVVAPDSGSGPGVLVLHAWWGLTPFFRTICDRLADEGFVALAPDLHGDDRTADTPDEAEAL